MASPSKLKQGYVTKPQLINMAPSTLSKNKAGRIIDDLRKEVSERGIFEQMPNKPGGSVGYQYGPEFQDLAKEKFTAAVEEKSALAKAKECDPDYMTDAEVARKFRTTKPVVRKTIDKYEIGKGTDFVKVQEPEWFIHISLLDALRLQLVPGADLMPVSKGNRVWHPAGGHL